MPPRVRKLEHLGGSPPYTGIMNLPRLALVCFVLVSALLSPATALALEVGDRLPALSDVAWIDGKDAVGEVDVGTVTVVDLWAPENPACRATMPRLTDLQKRHPEVRVIGLTGSSDAATRRFVTGMGSRIGYRIGVVTDLKAFVPSVGAPCALVIDRRGSVVWWGDAMDVPGPLARVLDGTFVPEPVPFPAQIRPIGPALSSALSAEAPLSYTERAERRSTVVYVDRPRVVCVPHPCWWAVSVHGGACSGRFILPHPPLILLPSLRCFWH